MLYFFCLALFERLLCYQAIYIDPPMSVNCYMLSSMCFRSPHICLKVSPIVRLERPSARPNVHPRGGRFRDRVSAVKEVDFLIVDEPGYLLHKGDSMTNVAEPECDNTVLQLR